VIGSHPSAISWFILITQKYPEATVGALVVNPNGEVLIVRSSKWNDRFTVPGGHIELGELAEDAIKREVREETGLDVEVVKLLLVQQAIYPKFYCKHEHFVFMDYLCRTQGTDVKLDDRELQHYVWVNPHEALKLDLEEYTRNFVEAYNLLVQQGYNVWA
jgi:nucleoside triphosphatase